MGLVTGEFKHPTMENVEISVDAKDKDEVREPWEIVSLDINFATIRTPQDLIDLGQWLVNIGAQIPSQFTEMGKKRRKPYTKKDFQKAGGV